MAYFKLGVNGEGYALFVPDSYSKDEKIIGSSIRRTISGKAKRDIITTKHTFSLEFDEVTDKVVAILYAQFEKYVREGKELTFVDDEGKSYKVHWGDNFGLTDRSKNEHLLWSGTITLEEV